MARRNGYARLVGAERGSGRLRASVLGRLLQQRCRRRVGPHLHQRQLGQPGGGRLLIEAVERAEEAVVSKQARVVEEVALSKDVDTRTETVRDTVRKTEVEVENEDDRTGRGSTGTEEITTSRERSDR